MLVARKLPLQRRQHADDPLRWHPRIEESLGGFQKKQILKGKLERLFFASDWRKKAGAHERADATTWKIQDFRHLAGGEKFHFLADWALFLPLSASTDLARTAGFFSLATSFPRLSLSACIKSITLAR